MIGFMSVDGRFKVTSTSRQTAEVEPIVLREGSTVRLVFHPALVDNPANPDAAVRGTFTYQRKGRRDEWEDVHDLQLSKLRKGESVQLELHSEELLRFVRSVGPLYKVVSESGIPFGETEFVRVDRKDLQALFTDAAQRDALFSDAEIGAIQAFVRWIADRPAEAVSALQALGSQNLAAFEAAAGIARLHTLLTEWRTNRQNSEESFWQELLTRESWVIAQLFAAPFVIVRGKAYVGGKTYQNVAGRVADFFFRNRLTGNVLLVEIKTPGTPLLAQEYRHGVFPISRDMSGAIAQALDQRMSLMQNYENLELKGAAITPFHPRTLVLAGDLELQEVTGGRLRSFELFRNELRGVEVITFNELAAKAEALLDLFRASPREV